MSNTNKLFFLLIFLLALAVNFIGINTDFFSDDPGLYASISKTMLYRHDVLQLFSYGEDWLDKPHFPFWAVYVSFKVFGISPWAYKLPALLCFLLSLVYTYLFARKFYTAEIAATAVLILMTALHLILSNTDVRAEPYLTAFIIGSIYHISRLNERFAITDLFLAALLTAFAIMTKGIFVIVPIFGSLLGQLIFEKHFTDIFKGKWWLLYLLTFIFCLPEIYALYIQFDLHPEKTVFGKHNVSGIYWFLWDSQFGRFANNGPIQHTSGDVFFYLHTLLWAFLPWCLLFYYSVYRSIKSIWQKTKLTEYYSLAGGLLLLGLFSLSRFQLPFYTNIIFPLFAVISAPYCYKQLSRAGENLRKISLLVFAILLPLVIIGIHILLKPATSIWFVVDCVLFGGIAITVAIKVKQTAYRLFLFTCCAALFANFYLITTVFKTVTAYNGQVSAAKYLNQHPFNKYPVYSLRPSNNIFQFYCNTPVAYLPMDQFKDFKPAKRSVFFISETTKGILEKEGARFTVIKAFTDYSQENIVPAFINKATRPQVLENVYLIYK